MLIPYQQLSEAALQGLLEDFVSRDGTDNGDETPYQTKIQRARAALESKQAVIVFDPATQQCQLCLRHMVPQEWLAQLHRLDGASST
ncbi:MAG: YheU family protein [Gammaproteobacteria bacterium]|nr:YheU family protein [Gammaproteobacteria bacterium]